MVEIKPERNDWQPWSAAMYLYAAKCGNYVNIFHNCVTTPYVIPYNFVCTYFVITYFAK